MAGVCCRSALMLPGTLRVHGFVVSWTSCTSQEWWIHPVREFWATCKNSEGHLALERRGIYIPLIEPGEVARVWIRLNFRYREILKHMNAQRPSTLIVRLKTLGKAVASSTRL